MVTVMMAFMFVSIYLTIDNLARKLFLWNKQKVQLTQNVIDRMNQEKMQKQKIVAYLFHEGNVIDLFLLILNLSIMQHLMGKSVRNPINNVSLATELLCDLIDKYASETTPSLKPAPDPTNSLPRDGIATPRRRCPTQEQWEEIVELIDNIRKSTESTRCVLDDALDIEKLASGSFVFSHKPFW